MCQQLGMRGLQTGNDVKQQETLHNAPTHTLTPGHAVL